MVKFGGGTENEGGGTPSIHGAGKAATPGGGCAKLKGGGLCGVAFAAKYEADVVFVELA